jgi:hypothetical protein
MAWTGLCTYTWTGPFNFAWIAAEMRCRLSPLIVCIAGNEGHTQNENLQEIDLQRGPECVFQCDQPLQCVLAAETS